MEIYCVHSLLSRWCGYYTTLEKAKEVLWELYEDTGWYEEDMDSPSLIAKMRDYLDEELAINDVGNIEVILVED